MVITAMNYCSQCGNPVTLRIPPGDTHKRYVCIHCDTVHYENPKLVVGAIVEHEGNILLCRRAIDPRRGYWTLPAGFMENRESTSEGAARETLEEACAQIEIDDLYAVFDIPHISQVHLIYRAHLLGDYFAAGDESLEVAMFSPRSLPWESLAFRTIELTLKQYCEDIGRPRSGILTATLRPD